MSRVAGGQWRAAEGRECWSTPPVHSVRGNISENIVLPNQHAYRRKIIADAEQKCLKRAAELPLHVGFPVQQVQLAQRTDWKLAPVPKTRHLVK